MGTHESREYLVHQLLVVKGICILGVIAIHVSGDFSSMPGMTWLTAGLLLINSLSRFAVPVFIMLSGFYLSLNPRNTRALPFYGRTLRFLVIPYVFYSLFYTLLKFKSGLSLSLLVKNVLLGSAYPHLWFSLLILQVYLFHPFLSRFFKDVNAAGRRVILAFGVQVLWSVLFSLFVPNPDLQRAGSGALARIGKFLLPSSVGFLFFGYYLAARSEEAVAWLKRAIVKYAAIVTWIVAGAASALFWGIPMSQGIAYRDIRHAYLGQSLLLPLISVAAFAVLFIFANERKSRPAVVRDLFHRFGLYSYGVYYLHPFFVKVCTKVVHQVLNLSYDNVWGYAILFILVPSVSLVAVKMLSKIPLGRYFV